VSPRCFLDFISASRASTTGRAGSGGIYKWSATHQWQQWQLGDWKDKWQFQHGYVAGRSCGVPVYIPAFASTSLSCNKSAHATAIVVFWKKKKIKRHLANQGHLKDGHHRKTGLPTKLTLFSQIPFLLTTVHTYLLSYNSLCVYVCRKHRHTAKIHRKLCNRLVHECSLKRA